MKLTGRILDERYSSLLLKRLDIDLWDAIALDKVQKKRRLRQEEFKRLKKLGLIEGRRPNIFVAAQVADAVGDRAGYIKNRAFDKRHYEEMISSYLGEYGEATRKDIDVLLLGKLSDALDQKQKRSFVSNLLQSMRRSQKIRVVGSTRGAKWRLDKPVRKSDD